LGIGTSVGLELEAIAEFQVGKPTRGQRIRILLLQRTRRRNMIA
jgi:hypothetical protein